MALDDYRPRSMPEQEWRDFMRHLADRGVGVDVVRVFQLDYARRAKASILEKMLQAQRRVRQRKIGAWKTRTGLSPDDRRPDLPRSVSTYGGLFFGSQFGFHREFEHKRGIKYGGAGSFVIIWFMGRDGINLSPPGRPHLAWHDKMGRGVVVPAYFDSYYNTMASVYALIEEAERRKDVVSLVVSPRAVEFAVDEMLDTGYSREVYEGSQWMAEETVPPVWNEKGEVVEPEWHASPPLRLNVAEELQNTTQSMRFRNFRGLLSVEDRLEIRREWIQWKSSPKRRLGGFSQWGYRVAPVSPHFTTIGTVNYRHLKNVVIEMRPMTYKHVVQGVEAQQRKRIGPGTDPDLSPALGVLSNHLSRLKLRRRGTLIMMASYFSIARVWGMCMELRQLHNTMDLFYFDLNPIMPTRAFECPEFLKNGKSIVNYVYIGTDVAHLTERVLKAIGGSVEFGGQTVKVV